MNGPDVILEAVITASTVITANKILNSAKLAGTQFVQGVQGVEQIVRIVWLILESGVNVELRQPNASQSVALRVIHVGAIHPEFVLLQELIVRILARIL